MRAWHERQSTRELGSLAADKCSAIAARLNLREDFDVMKQCIKMWKKGRDIYVTTVFQKETGEICLPPCVPRQQMIYDKSEDEKAVRITVKPMHDPTVATKQRNKQTRQ